MTHEPSARPGPIPPPERPRAPISVLSQIGGAAAGIGALLAFVGMFAPNSLTGQGGLLVTGGLLLCVLDVLRHIYLYGVPRR